jgi:hypothetical protein
LPLLLALTLRTAIVTLFTGGHGEALLVALLAAGGLGLGIQFSALIVHLTNVVPAEYASDLSRSAVLARLDVVDERGH